MPPVPAQEIRLRREGMAYFNPFTRLPETAESTTLEPSSDGSAGYVSRSITTHLYRCEAIVPGTQTRCRLVWDRASLAKDCALHNHRNQWLEYYYGQYSPGDGLPPVIWEQSYPRRAVRRDGDRPERTPAPVPTQPAAAPALALADLKAQALVLGYRLSKIPASKATETPDETPAF